MKSDWESCLLGDLIEINQNNIGKNHAFENICYVDISSVGSGTISYENVIKLSDAPSRAKRLAVNGDTIISTVRPGNRSFAFLKKCPINSVYSTGFAVLHPNQDKINPRFLYYTVSDYSFTGYLTSVEKGASYPSIDTNDIKSAQILIPNIKNQNKIASILSAYDDLIENNLKRIKLLEEKAQLTYEEWFVRMKYPGHENDVVDSETGLPEGWHKKRISEICDFSGGGTPSKSKGEYWNNGDLTWFAPTDLSKSNSLVQLDSSSKITEIGLKKSSAKLLGADSFMMTSRATVGLFGITNKPFSTNQGFINITPYELFHKEYLLYCFKHNTPLFLNYATGSTFLEISKSVFGKIRIAWPSSNIIKRYSDYVS